MKQTLHINTKKLITSWLFIVTTMMLFRGTEAYAKDLSQIWTYHPNNNTMTYHDGKTVIYNVTNPDSNALTIGSNQGNITSIGEKAFTGTCLSEIHLEKLKEGIMPITDTEGQVFLGLKLDNGKQSCNVFVPAGTDPNNETIPVKLNVQQDLLNGLNTKGFEQGKLPDRVKYDPLDSTCLEGLNKDIIITSGTEYENIEGHKGFYGSMLKDVTLGSLRIASSNTHNFHIDLMNVTVNTHTTIDQGTDVTMYLRESVVLGNLVNNGTLTFEFGIDEDSNDRLGTITNNGTFRDYSGQVTKVSGNSYMEIHKPLPEESFQPYGKPIMLEIGVKGNKGESDVTFEYLWQKKKTTPDEWDNLSSSTHNILINENDQETGEGTYRCIITRTEGNDTTMLTSYTYAFFTEPDPTPTPSTYYDVVLPEIEGAFTNPGAETYSVEESDSFWFTLTLADDYSQSKPIVKVGDKEIKPDNFGRYVIDYIYEYTEIKISGVEKNPAPTNIDGVNGTNIKVWATNGTLHIFTPHTADIRIVDFSGSPVKTIKNTSGANLFNLLRGNYIVIIGTETFKIKL